MTLEQIANSLSPEQYINLLNFVYGELPQNIQNMTDDELLAELQS